MKRKVFIVWTCIFLAWALYRAFFTFSDWIDEIIFKPLIFFLPIVLVVAKFERKSPATLGIAPKARDFFLDIYIGVVIGILFAFEGMLVNYLKNGEFSFTPILAAETSAGIVVYLLINLATSVWEEILGRGYLYQRLYQVTGKQMNAAIVSSVLFLLLHVPLMFTRLQLTGTAFLIYPLSIFLLGIANCYIFSLRKSLILPILIHLFWNMTVSLYL